MSMKLNQFDRLVKSPATILRKKAKLHMWMLYHVYSLQDCYNCRPGLPTQPRYCARPWNRVIPSAGVLCGQDNESLYRMASSLETVRPDQDHESRPQTAAVLLPPTNSQHHGSSHSEPQHSQSERRRRRVVQTEGSCCLVYGPHRTG